MYSNGTHLLPAGKSRSLDIIAEISGKGRRHPSFLFAAAVIFENFRDNAFCVTLCVTSCITKCVAAILSIRCQFDVIDKAMQPTAPARMKERSSRSAQSSGKSRKFSNCFDKIRKVGFVERLATELREEAATSFS